MGKLESLLVIIASVVTTIAGVANLVERLAGLKRKDRDRPE
jgi:hypothetical protein